MDASRADLMLGDASHTAAVAERLRAESAGDPLSELPRIAFETIIDLDDDALMEALSGVDRFGPGSIPRDSAPSSRSSLPRLGDLSDAHEQRFGFLLVIASAGRPVDLLIAEAEARRQLDDRPQAVDAARRALTDIVRGRLARALDRV